MWWAVPGKKEAPPPQARVQSRRAAPRVPRELLRPGIVREHQRTAVMSSSGQGPRLPLLVPPGETMSRLAHSPRVITSGSGEGVGG